MPSFDGQDLDHVYDLVELCHDLVARPRIRTYHGFCESGTTTGSIGRPDASCMCGGSTPSSPAGVELRLSDSGEDEGRLVALLSSRKRIPIRSFPSSDVVDLGKEDQGDRGGDRRGP